MKSRAPSPSPAVVRRQVLRCAADGAAGDWDDVAVEAPLELRAAGSPRVVVMRTPGDDIELAAGLLFGEGVITADEVGLVGQPARPGATAGADNVIEVALSEEALAARWPARGLDASSACGVCGKSSIAALELRAGPVRAQPRVPAGVLAALPDALRRSQTSFALTGGVHAAGLFTVAGELLVIREDVGRHNAVDKIVGWSLLHERVPLADAILCVSGRLSFEIVQKAVVAGVPILVAVSAPSSLAIDLAEQFRVTLCGFTRSGRFNLYTHSTRVDQRW